jgi:hypothetical protein
MKYLRIPALLGALFSLAVAIPVIPAAAASPYIQLSDDAGQTGDEISILGDNFNQYDSVDVYFSNDPVDTGDNIGDEVMLYRRVKASQPVGDDGEIFIDFTIPSSIRDYEAEEQVDVSDGAYYIYITEAGEQNILAVADFAVGDTGSEWIHISRTYGAIGQRITVSGADLRGIALDIYFAKDNAGPGEQIGSNVMIYKLVKSGVDLNAAISVPSSIFNYDTGKKVNVKQGTYYVYTTYEGSNTIVARAVFRIRSLEINSAVTSVTGGDIVTVTGSGFVANSNLDIELGNVLVATERADSQGQFTAQFSVPGLAAGTYRLTVTDNDGNTDSLSFTIEATSCTTCATTAVTTCTPGCATCTPPCATGTAAPCSNCSG